MSILMKKPSLATRHAQRVERQVNHSRVSAGDSSALVPHRSASLFPADISDEMAAMRRAGQ